MADDQQSEIEALRARLAALEAGGAAAKLAPDPTRAKRGKKVVTAVLVVAGLGVAALVSQSGGADPAPANPFADSATDWPLPEGYTRYDAKGTTVGMKWVKPTDAECKGRGGCWAMNVVTSADCENSLYGSITLLGEGDNNVGWTNDTAQGVQAGEITRLVFNTYEQGVKSARVAELNCY